MGHDELITAPGNKYKVTGRCESSLASYSET